MKISSDKKILLFYTYTVICKGMIKTQIVGSK